MSCEPKSRKHESCACIALSVQMLCLTEQNAFVIIISIASVHDGTEAERFACFDSEILNAQFAPVGIGAVQHLMI